MNTKKSIEEISGMDLSSIGKNILSNHQEIKSVDKVGTVLVDGFNVFVDADGVIITDINLLKKLPKKISLTAVEFSERIWMLNFVIKDR